MNMWNTDSKHRQFKVKKKQEENIHEDFQSCPLKKKKKAEVERLND